jgi:tetratricopeptide (TPR) repeat protein
MEVRVKLEGGDVSRHKKYVEKYYRGKQSLDCYLKLIEASGYQAHFNIENNSMARRLVEDAIAMCPENPMGYVRLGSIYHYDYWLGTTKSPRETLEKSIELVQKALTMDDSIANGHSVLCTLYAHKREFDKAIAEGERAVALSPGNWISFTSYAHSLTLAGRSEEAIPLLQKALRLTPFGGPILYCEFGLALRNVGRFKEAVSAFKKALQIAPDNILGHILLTATYSIMGREKEARVEAKEVLRINPKFSLDYFANRLAYKDQSEADKVVYALRKAGLK